MKEGKIFHISFTIGVIRTGSGSDWVNRTTEALMVETQSLPLPVLISEREKGRKIKWQLSNGKWKILVPLTS